MCVSVLVCVGDSPAADIEREIILIDGIKSIFNKTTKARVFLKVQFIYIYQYRSLAM